MAGHFTLHIAHFSFNRCYFVGKSGAVWGKMCIFDGEIHIKYVCMRFIGNISGKTDAKGRVFMPAAFRKILQAAGEQHIVLRKDVFQSCLVVYPESVWNGVMDMLRLRLNRWNRKEQQVFRQFVSDVEILTLDGNGRFLIPKRYLQMAAIQQEVNLVGVDDTIEIWSAEAMAREQLPVDEFGKAVEEIMGEV